MERFAGFTWTFPVHWAGFTQLPSRPEEAAEASRTIRYQRERIRRWVAEHRGELVLEEVFLELRPDRGSREIVQALDDFLDKATKENARLVVVRFREVHGWRAHQHLEGWIERHGDKVVALDPEPLGGEDPFDPVEHFRAWAAAQEDWSSSKTARRAAIAHAMVELDGPALTNADLAARLNDRGVRTITGKAWTAETVRKSRRLSGPSRGSVLLG